MIVLALPRDGVAANVQVDESGRNRAICLVSEQCGRLHIAEAVCQELNAAGQHWPGRDEVATAEWFERHTVQNQVLITALQRDLHRGEAETIALA